MFGDSMVHGLTRPFYIARGQSLVYTHSYLSLASGERRGLGPAGGEVESAGRVGTSLSLNCI